MEVIAVWGPAAIGIGAFAAAASQGVENLYQHMSQMLDIVNSTPGTASKLDPLTGGFLAMQNAVQPAVYELWGDAITVASSKSGALLGIVTNDLVDTCTKPYSALETALSGFFGSIGIW